MSTSNNDGGPAFPMPAHVAASGEQTYPIYGMTLRDWFAGQALACVNTHAINDTPAKSKEQRTAIRCYRLADAMLAAREVKE